MFCLGYPVDYGPQSFIVRVRLVQGQHCYKNGRKSERLRRNSGAEFVFALSAEKIQKEYGLEFEMVPEPPNISTISPENHCLDGYSDGAACALAILQYRPEQNKEGTLVLVSCSPSPFHPQNQGLSRLLLDKVTGNDPQKAAESLKNKWEASCRHKALALVLHEEDARILSQTIGVEATPLTKASFWQWASSPGKTRLVSCQSEQLPLLAKSLNFRNRTHLIMERSNALISKIKTYRKAIAIFLCFLFIASMIYLFCFCPPYIPVSLMQEDREVAFTEASVPLCTTGAQIKLKLKEPCYFYFFSLAKGSEVPDLKKDYCLTPQDVGIEISLNTDEFPKDTTFFFLNDQEKIIKTTEDELKWTEKLITASKELGILDRGLQSQKYSSAAIFPDGVLKWSFYSKRRYGNSYACIGKLDILRSPLSIKIYIKRGSDRNYKLLNPKKDAVAEGDEWKLSLYVRHKVDMVLFLRDNKQKNIRLPIRQGDESLQSVNQGLLNMSYNEVCFDNVEGTEYLCCFYSTGKLDVPAIEKWLNDNRLESILSNDQKQYGEFVIPYKNNIFYDHPLPTSLYLISFRHIKRDQN